MEDYNQIVNDWYIALRSHFINTIHTRFPLLRIEDIEDVYNETFLAVRNNIVQNRVASGTNWKGYIFQIGLNMSINRMKQTGKKWEPIEESNDDDIDSDEKFQTSISLQDLIDSDDDDKEQIEQRLEVLKREIRYLPAICDTIIKDFYYGGFSMEQIMQEIHYQSTNAVKAKKYWCMDRLKERSKIAFKMLNL